MDILNSDLQLKTEATTRKRGSSYEDDESNTAFHFIAFMPAMGQLWKFDGLERQPRTLGRFKTIYRERHGETNGPQGNVPMTTGSSWSGPIF